MLKRCEYCQAFIRFVLMFLCFSGVLSGQPDSTWRPVIGLTLSGGGAKGFAHIGVLKVLEEINMPIDCITGTSMGSIVGGLYAIGYRAADLEKIATTTDWDIVLKDGVERNVLSMEQKFYDARYHFSLDIEDWRVKLPSGLIAGQNVIRMLNRLTQPVQHIHDFTQFPIPFVCVATDIVTGKAVVLKEGSLAEAIRASMAIPSAFTPIKIDDKLLVDGMIARNFPVQEAREVLGADIVIGVDVGEELADEEQLDSFLSIMNQAASFQMVASTLAQRKLCNYLIIPDISNHGAGSFGHAQYFIDQGEAAARAKLPQLRALLDSIKGLPDPPSRETEYLYHPAAPQDSLYISDVKIEGLQELPKNFVIERLNLPLPGRHTLSDIELGIDRVYGSQFFERVSYELTPNFHGKRLVLHVKERARDIFRIGFHYDTKNEAAVLLNTTFRNKGRPGSFLSFDTKLSSDLLFEGKYFTRTGFRRLIGLRWRLVHAQQSVDQFEGDNRFARQRVQSTFGEIFLGTIFSNKITIGGGGRLEYTRIKPTIAPVDFQTVTEDLLVFFGSLTIDTFNRTNFPTRGTFVRIEADHSTTRILSSSKFTRLFFDGRFVIPLTENMSLLSGFLVGNAINDLPFHYQFMLGGVNMPFTYLGNRQSFYGFRPQEFSGDNAQFAQIGIQYEFLPRRYLLFHGNSGNTFEDFLFKIDPERYFYGGGITAGMNTRLGPVTFTVMSSERHGFLTHLNIGFIF